MKTNDPLHGVTLEKLLHELVAHFGWDGLARRIDIRCFRYEPSITSSLRFLRRTPWARTKVEDLYRDYCLQQRRQDGGQSPHEKAAPSAARP